MSGIFKRRNSNQLYIQPNFSPNISCENSSKCCNSPSVYGRNKSPVIQNLPNGRINFCDINGPLFLYFPGNSSKLFIQGNNENEIEQELNRSLRNQDKSSIQNQEKASFTQNKEEGFENYIRNHNDILNKDNISERPDISSQNEEISENCDDCSKTNNRGKSSDKYLTNKINIELSESNNTQNIECRIKSASKHEIVFSSKTSDKCAHCGRGEDNQITNWCNRTDIEPLNKTIVKTKDSSKFLNKTQEFSEERNIRSPKRRIVIKNLKGKKIKKLNKAKIFQKENSELQSHLNNQIFSNINKNNDDNIDLNGFFENCPDQHTLPNKISSPKNKNVATSTCTSANTTATKAFPLFSEKQIGTEPINESQDLPCKKYKKENFCVDQSTQFEETDGALFTKTQNFQIQNNTKSSEHEINQSKDDKNVQPQLFNLSPCNEPKLLELKRDSPEFGVSDDYDSLQVNCTPKLGLGKSSNSSITANLRNPKESIENTKSKKSDNLSDVGVNQKKRDRFESHLIPQDKISIASGIQYSEANTAQFNSSRRKSISSNHSSSKQKKDSYGSKGVQNHPQVINRRLLQDPLSFLRQYEVIMK